MESTDKVEIIKIATKRIERRIMSVGIVSDSINEAVRILKVRCINI